MQAGDVLAGKYRVEHVLGHGGMGIVVAARHLQLDERVALKFMLPDAMRSAEIIARFQREARLAVKLKSEHVARVYDVGTLETGAPYIVMEYLEGRDLSALLLERGALSVEEAADYVLQACDAVAEAHSLGMVHRDLKPGNLFVTRRGDGTPLVKVLDFGISKANALSEGAVAMTKSSTMMGSPLYMSPEQTKSSRDVDVRSDVWSLGVILYELVAGRVPFHAETVGALIAKVLTEAPPPLRAVRSDVPESFASLVMRCLEKDPERRWASVADVAHGLAPFAPARVKMIAERVAGVVRTSRPSEVVSPLAGAALPPAPAASEPPLSAGPSGLPRSGVTAASFGGTASGLPRPRGRKVVVLTALTVVGVAAIGAAVLAMTRPVRSSAAVTTARDVVASTTASNVGPPPPSGIGLAAADTASPSATPSVRPSPATPKIEPLVQRARPPASVAARPASPSATPPPPPPAPPPPAPPAPTKKDVLKDWN